MKQLNPHSHAKARDIRNQKAKLREEELGGRTSTEALLELLMNSDDWATSWAKDPNTSRLNRLLFCNHKGIELAQNRPEILLIDATYKTNQFNMPLLHFAGVYPSNARKGTSFSIGFCFLLSKEETTYQWAVREFQKAVYGDQFKPTIIVTDNDTGLRNSISTVCGLPSRLSFADGISTRTSLRRHKRHGGSMALMKRRGRGMETSVMRLWSAGLTSHTQKQRNLSRRHIGSSKMITLNN
jgi:hypothetical protein